MDSFFYCLGQGMRNIRRNSLFSIASIATMTTCLFLFGVMYFVLINVEHIIQNAESNVGVTVFFTEGITDAQRASLQADIEGIEGVKSVTYVDAEQAWEYYKSTYLEDVDLASFNGDNPLKDSDSFTILFESVDYEESLVATLQSQEYQNKGVRKVNSTQELIDTLQKVNKAMSIGSFSIIVLLLFIATFLISTTITMGVSIRRREISIMHLIGATDIFVRGPFLVEGIVIGFLGSCIPLTVLYLLYFKIVALIVKQFSGVVQALSLVDVNEVFAFLTPVVLIIGIGIGFLGSYFTLNKQLAKIRQL